MPDSGGEGEEAGGDSGVGAFEGAPAVLFEGELAFEGVEDGLDPLPDTAEFSEAGFLVFAVGADQVRTEVFGDESFEVFPGEPFVAEDDLPGVDEVVVVFQERLGDFAFADFRVGQPPDDGQALGVPIR